MSRNDDIFYTKESTFKTKLRKLYQLVAAECRELNSDLNNFDFVSCEGFNDVIDVNYMNDDKDFTMTVRGSEKFGYRVLNSDISDALVEDDNA